MVKRERRNSAGSTASTEQQQQPSVARSGVFNKSLDDLLKEQRQKASATPSSKGDFTPRSRRPSSAASASSPAPNSLQPPKVLEPEALGLGGLRRRFPEADLRLLSEFVSQFPREAEELDAAVDELKRGDDMMRDIKTRLIVLDMLKNMGREKVTVREVARTLKESRNQERTMQDIGKKIWGENLGRRSKKDSYQVWHYLEIEILQLRTCSK